MEAKKKKMVNIGLCLFFTLVSVLTIYPTLKIATYSYPVQDDFAYVTNIRNLVAQNNSVFKACILQSIEYYKHFVGAYSSSFMGHFFEYMINGQKQGIVCFEIVSMLIFYTALAFFCYAVVRKIFKYPVVAVFGVYAVMVTLVNNTIYYPEAENYYWLITSIQYLLILSFVLMGIYFMIMSAYAKKKGVAITLAIVAGICTFWGSGGNLILVFLNVSVCFLVMCMIYMTGHATKLITVPFITACIGAIINGLAPGNFERKGAPVTASMIMHSGYNSFKYSYERLEEMVAQPIFVITLIVLVLILIYCSKDIPAFKTGYKMPVVAVIFTWCFVAATIFPGILGYGYDIYKILMRGNELSDFMIYTVLLIDAIYIAGWIRYKFFANASIKISRDIIVILALIAVFAGFKLRNDAWRWTPTVRMYREISSGRMQEYSDYVWSVYNRLMTDKEDDVYVYVDEVPDKTCMISPYFVYGDHDENFRQYDKSIVTFYGKNALYLYSAQEEQE